MDAKQIQLLKSTHMMETERNGKRTTLGAYVRFCLDSGIEFITSKDMVIFDDENNMLHCIAINEDGRSQADYPVKVISTDYSIVHQVESIYNQKDFEKMIKEGFLNGVISEDKKDAIIKWSNNIRNQAIQPSRVVPCYSPDPTIIPMGNTVLHSVESTAESDELKESYDVTEVEKELNEETEVVEETDGETKVVEQDGINEESITTE